MVDKMVDKWWIKLRNVNELNFLPLKNVIESQKWYLKYHFRDSN